jgi:RES domain-containing protein
MMIQAWRIVKARYAKSAFSGEGARRAGGRWNSPGFPLVYLAGSTSLAILEMLVHLDSDALIERYVLYETTFDDSLATHIDPASLPKNWQRVPSPPGVKRIGDMWIRNASSVVLRVPSAIVPIEWNYLVNPAHPNFSKVTIGPKKAIRFDPRLSKHKN